MGKATRWSKASKYTLIDALSANSAAYLHQMVDGGKWTYNAGYSLVESSVVSLYIYPDITVFDLDLPIRNFLGNIAVRLKGKMQINGATGFTIRYKGVDDDVWSVFENSNVSPIKFPHSLFFSSLANWTSLDKTPDPVPIEITFPVKGSYAIEVTKFSAQYTVNHALAEFGKEIHDWFDEAYSGHLEGLEKYWRYSRQTPLNAGDISLSSYANGGVLGVKSKNTYSNIRVYSREGTHTQTRLPGFSNLSRFVNMPPNSKITKTAPQYHTLTNPCDGVKVRIQCPALFKASDSGDLKETSVDFNIAYRKTSGVTWVTAKTKDGSEVFSMKEKTSSTVDGYFTVWFPSKDNYVIRVTRITDDSESSKLRNDTYLSSVVEIEHTDIAYINRAVFGLILKATDSLSGTNPTVTVVVKGRKVRSVKEMVETGSGGVVEKFSQNPADFVVDAMTHKRYGGGRHYGLKNIDFRSALEFWEWCEELVPFYIEKANISDYSSDAFYVHGDYFKSGSGYFKCIKNYSDGMSGILPTNTEYFLQLSVMDEFVVDMHKRFEINFVVDQKYRLNDFIAKICETCRVKPYWIGDKLAFFIDKPGIPSQMFSMGNIVPNTFQEDYTSSMDIPNQIEATYKDASLDYEEKTVICVDFERQQKEDVKNNEVQLFGLTDRHRIKRELFYYLRRAKAITKKISFETNASALYSNIGDLIWFQFYTPYYGDGGHIVRVDGNIVHLSTPIAQTYMYSYGIRIQRQNVTDPVTVEKIFYTSTWPAAITGEIHEIDLGANHGVSVGDVYQAGLIGKEAKPFRITSIQEKEYKVQIEAEEYNESVYNEWVIDPEILDYSGFGNRPLSENYVPNVVEISLVEQVLLSGSGEVSNILVSFKQPVIFNKTSEFVDRCEVYYKENTSPVWMKAGETKETSFIIPGVKIGSKYYVCVRAKTNLGNTGFLSNDWYIQDLYSIMIYGQVDAIFENGVYEPGVFISPQENAGFGSRIHTTLWLMEPNEVTFTFTDEEEVTP